MFTSLKALALLLVALSYVNGQSAHESSIKELYEKKLKAAGAVTDKSFPRRNTRTSYKNEEETPSYTSVSEETNDSLARFHDIWKESGVERRHSGLIVGDQYFEQQGEQAWVCVDIYPIEINHGSRLRYFTPLELLRDSYEVVFVDSNKGSFTRLRKITTNIRSKTVETEITTMVDEKGRIVEYTWNGSDGSWENGVWTDFKQKVSVKYEYDGKFPEIVSPFPGDLQSCKIKAY